MIRVVADTNILISALIFGGVPAVFLDLALLDSFQLLSSPVLLDELADKLGTKFELSVEDVARIRTRLELAAIIVSPTINLTIVKDDPDDDRVIECAVSGHADCIVSGDRHLLKLGAYQAIRILTVREFLNQSVPQA